MRFLLCLMLGGLLVSSRSTGEPSEGANRAARLTVIVEGCTEARGSVLIAIYGTAEAFAGNDPKKAAATARLPAGKGSLTHDFILPEGTYAILIAQDLNGNHRVDKNWLGVPTEPIGVSRGFKSKLRKPTFAECSFALHPPKQHIDIRLERF